MPGGIGKAYAQHLSVVRSRSGTSRRKARLEAIVRRPSSPQALVQRARIALLAHANWPNARIAAKLGCTLGTVRTWRRRFARGGKSRLCATGLAQTASPEYGPDVDSRSWRPATPVPPEGVTAWTHALIAGPVRHGHLRFPDPAGSWLTWNCGRTGSAAGATAATTTSSGHRPPRSATSTCARQQATMVICIDEKTGIQAKYRKYPERPPRPGQLARREFEYVRNGTVSIVAALQIATGQVITEPITRNNPVTFTGFLHRLDQCIAPHLSIHIVMDNGSSHTSRATRAWIAAHPRISVTYTPKHASWLDMAELWFSVLTRALLRRGQCPSGPTSPARSPASPSATTGPPSPGPGPTTPAPTTHAISPATPGTTIPWPPGPPPPAPSPQPHDHHETGGLNPSRTYAGLH